MDDEQNDELVDIMEKFETVGKDALEEISETSTGDTRRRIWEDDKRSNTTDILDQQQNSMYMCIVYSYCIC